MGRDHLKNALTLQQAGVLSVVGLVDADVERARTPGAEQGIASFADHEALLAEARPHFVSVATPHHLARYCWLAGLPSRV